MLDLPDVGNSNSNHRCRTRKVLTLSPGYPTPASNSCIDYGCPSFIVYHYYRIQISMLTQINQLSSSQSECSGQVKIHKVDAIQLSLHMNIEYYVWPITKALILVNQLMPTTEISMGDRPFYCHRNCK